MERARSGLVPVASSKMWTDEGGVTKPRGQGRCGSCWAFGITTAIETSYFAKTGILKSLSDKEFLDCVYENKRNGRHGGRRQDAIRYSRDNGGRLARLVDYPYRAKDEDCRKGTSPNALISYKIKGYTTLIRTENADIQALQSGALAAAIRVTKRFQQYRSGILKDETCKGGSNHAVAIVSYTETVLVKNSWGASWGNNGFIRMARNHGKLWFIQILYQTKTSRKTGVEDTSESEKGVTYTPNTGGGKQCEDKWKKCNNFKHECDTRGHGEKELPANLWRM